MNEFKKLFAPGHIGSLEVKNRIVMPPMATHYCLKGVAPEDVTLSEIFRAAIPFSLVYLIGIILVVAFPPIATWLPGRMLK